MILRSKIHTHSPAHNTKAAKAAVMFLTQFDSDDLSCKTKMKAQGGKSSAVTENNLNAGSEVLLRYVMVCICLSESDMASTM